MPRIVLLPFAAAIASASPLSDRAVETLTEILAVGTPVDQIHAAEVLIPFGHARVVWEHYHSRQGRFDETPIYRITDWRALARVDRTSAAREQWIHNLYRVALTPGLPDRVHAAESIAKLQIAPPPHVVAAMQTWADTAAEKDAAFAWWCAWGGQIPSDAGPQIVAWLQSDDSDTRLRTAYMLARLRPSDSGVLAALADAANAADEVDLPNTVIVLAAHFLAASPANKPAWRLFLEDAITTGDARLIFHAVPGLMPALGPEDVPDYIPLLDHSEPDARTSAAWVILHASGR